MQPVVQATTRTPGPSTVEPVVNECRKPMSPVASAVRTSVSGTSLPRLTRSSNGLFASSDRLIAPGALRHRRVAPWNVRLMTSICCSRVSRTKLTA